MKPMERRSLRRTSSEATIGATRSRRGFSPMRRLCPADWRGGRDIATSPAMSWRSTSTSPRRSLRPRSAATDLTIILPTFDRPALCRAQVQFLRRTKFRHRVIVADSSEQPDPELLRSLPWADRIPPIRRCDRRRARRSRAVARSVATPYVAVVTDDDISFPHAIDACLAFPSGQPRPCGRPGLRAQRHPRPGDVRHPERAVVHAGDCRKARRWGVSTSSCVAISRSSGPCCAPTRIFRHSMRQITPKDRSSRNSPLPQRWPHSENSSGCRWSIRCEVKRSRLREASNRHPFYWFLSNSKTFLRVLRPATATGWRHFINELAERRRTGQRGSAGGQGDNARQPDPSPRHHPRYLFWPGDRHRHDQPYRTCSSRRPIKPIKLAAFEVARGAHRSGGSRASGRA